MPFQWLGAISSLRVVARKAGAISVVFDAVNAEIPRLVTFGELRRQVSTAPPAIRLCVHVDESGAATLPIATDPAPRRLLGGDLRVAGIGIYHLRAERDCG